jgi:hypothetical protein
LVECATGRIFWIIYFRVQSPLPATGTAELLELLSPFVPDDFINRLLSGNRRQGRQNYFSVAQLWRIHLLTVLTPAHSFNAVVRLLPEQRAWRRFARLDHRHRTPDVRMLCEFRAQAGVAALRRINEQMVKRLLRFLPRNGQTVAVIDATDLPASTADKKKTGAGGRPSGPPWAPAHSSLDTPGSLSVIKSTRCVCGCALTSPPSC